MHFLLLFGKLLNFYQFFCKNSAATRTTASSSIDSLRSLLINNSISISINLIKNPANPLPNCEQALSLFFLLLANSNNVSFFTDFSNGMVQKGRRARPPSQCLQLGHWPSKRPPNRPPTRQREHSELNQHK